MRLLALGLLCLSLASPGVAGARLCGDDVSGHIIPCDCGDVLVDSRTLSDADPITSHVCAGSGLLVAVPADRPSATLALAGHVLVGSGRGIGLQVLEGGAGGLTVTGPGGVRGFAVGVSAINGTLAQLSDVAAAENTSDGFVLVGDGYRITGCEALRNGRDGFALRGSGYRFDGNRALENGRHGVVLAGRGGVIGAAQGNGSVGNGRDGLRVRGRGHDVAHSIATANAGRGIGAHFAEGRIRDAVVRNNRGRGLQATGPDLTVADTEADANGGGIVVRGARVRDGGGNRADDCRVGGPCR